jgi:hypothetical protein
VIADAAPDRVKCSVRVKVTNEKNGKIKKGKIL